MQKCDFSIPIRQQMSPEEKAEILRLVQGRRVILEIGAWVGDTTSTLAEYAKSLEGVVYVVDWFCGNLNTHLEPVAKQEDIYSIFRSNMKSLDLWNHVKPLHMTSEDAALIVADDTFDFIFLDADHRYFPTKHDVHAWFPKLKIGGIFAGHDYDSTTYDESYIHQDSVNGKHNGLIKAVNERFGAENISRGAGSIWWARK